MAFPPELLLLEQERRRRQGPSVRPPCWLPAESNQPQQLAYALAASGSVMEIGYGGQAGGGKTDLLLGLAGTKFKRSRIMRREFPQLDGIIERGEQIYPVPFVGGLKKRWAFDGRSIMLRSMQYEKDWKKYQGQPIDFLGIDEAAEFSERAVRNITGWLRSATNPGEQAGHTLVVYASNPPTTPEGEWLIRYFAPWLDPQYGKPAEDGEIRWFIHMPGDSGRETIREVAGPDPVVERGETLYPISRTFIHASRRDNPFLGEDYERRLQALMEPLRSIIMNGDFTLAMQDDPWQVIPTNWVLAAQERWNKTKRPEAAQRSLGVDVAHGGADNTVISPLYGNWFDELQVFAGGATPNGDEAARRVELAWRDSAPIAVDAVGYGASAADTMINWGMSIIPVNFGAASDRWDRSRRFQYFNVRAEMYFTLRDALDPSSGEDICLPPSRTLRVDLCAPRFKIVRGKIQLEEKIKIKERLGRSPDEGDAVVLAWRAAQTGGGPIVLDW